MARRSDRQSLAEAGHLPTAVVVIGIFPQRGRDHPPRRGNPARAER